MTMRLNGTLGSMLGRTRFLSTASSNQLVTPRHPRPNLENVPVGLIRRDVLAENRNDVNPYGGEMDWERYCKIRPNYPKEVYDTIFDFHKAGGNEWNAALDVGCGPGTAATPVLAGHFGSVIGCDKNKPQLDIARRRFYSPNIAFRQSPGEDLSWMKTGSVDMITCATALHWIDFRAFIREAGRCLKRGGTLAAWTYLPLGSSGIEQVDATMRAIELKSLLKTLPPPEASPVSRYLFEALGSHYDNIEIPPQEFTHETRIHWNLQSPLYYSVFQVVPSADRRNPSGEGYKEVFADLDGINATYTRDEYLNLLFSLDHYTHGNSIEAVKQIWDIIGPRALLKQNRPVDMILARRK